MTTAASHSAARAHRAAESAPHGKASKAGARKAEDAFSGRGAVIGAAVAGAAGLALGLAANLGRKAMVQAPSALAGDWFDLVKTEHKMALAVFDQLQETTDDQPHKRSALLTTLKHAVSKHAFTEENVIYPALRDHGQAVDADELNREHGYIKQYFYDLENMPNESSEFLPKIASFRKDIEEHMQDEEERIFPPMHDALGPEKNKLVTAQANKEGFKLA